METNGREKTVSSSFIEWEFPGTKKQTKIWISPLPVFQEVGRNAGMGNGVITTESTVKFILLMLQL